MHWTEGGDDTLVTVLFEHRLLLPVLQHLQLGRDVLKLFFYLGEESLGGPGFFFLAEGQFDTFTQQRVGEAALTALA